MSYLVLARRLRPQRFEDLIGQESITRTLKNALKIDRVAHAFLFTGPRGTGKTSCARILTKALNCTALDHQEPCNRCENCLEINQGISADVMEIDAASNRGIDHIRELRESVKFSPSKGRFKTYIIDEVHMLTTESFNALLKTLEEPPSHVKFILATTDPHKIPITVVSRCQRFDFGYIPTVKMAAYLGEVAKKEKITISPESLNLIASAATGGMRDALTSLDMLVSFSGNQIEPQAVSELLGLGGEQETERLLAALVNQDLGEAMSLLNHQMRKGRSLDRLVSDLMTGFKDLSLLKELSPEKLGWRDFLAERLVAYQKMAAQCSTTQLQQMFHILIETELQMRRSNHGLICLEMAMVKLCKLDRVKGVAEIIALLQGGKGLREKAGPPKPTGPPNLETGNGPPPGSNGPTDPSVLAPVKVGLVKPTEPPQPATENPQFPAADGPPSRFVPGPDERGNEKVPPSLEPSLAVKPKPTHPPTVSVVAPEGSTPAEPNSDAPPLDLPQEPPQFVPAEPWEREPEYDPSPEDMGEPPPWAQAETPVERSPTQTSAPSGDLATPAQPNRTEPPQVSPPLAAVQPVRKVADKAPLLSSVKKGVEGATWPDFVARFAEEAPLALWALLKSCVALQFGPDKLQLGCFNPAVFSQEKRALIVAFACRFFGQTPKLEFVLSAQGQQDSLRAKELQTREVALHNRQDRAAQDEKVQAVLQAFPQSQIIDYPDNPNPKE